ncbi:MAG: hypothetical protein U9O65_02780 [Thermotogota bacterium]|nr:hypothetical protein [Thermotogota bacterium]
MRKILFAFLFLLLALPLYAGNKNDLAYLGYDELDTAASVDSSDGIVLFENNIPKKGKAVSDLLSVDDSITKSSFADEDWGDVSVSSNSVTLDSGVVDTAELADDAVTSGKIAQNVIQTASVDITTGEILALNTTPQELVAAPGAGYVIEFISAVLILDYNSAAYATNGDLSIQTDTTNTTLSDTVGLSDFLAQTADTIRTVQVLSADTNLDANEALELFCGTGDPATGDSPITVKVTYRILATGL